MKAEIEQLDQAIERLSKEVLQTHFKCGKCNGWTGYHCPQHQAIAAMERAKEALEIISAKITTPATLAHIKSVDALTASPAPTLAAAP